MVLLKDLFKVRTFEILSNIYHLIISESIHALNMSFHITRVILFFNLIGVNCILYMYLDPMSQVSNLLIYPSVIVLNKICTIGQALTTYPKPCTYG